MPRACPSDHVHDQVGKGMPPQLHWVAPASYVQTLVMSAQEAPVFGADAGHIEHTQTPDVHLHWWLGYTHDSPSSEHGCPYNVGLQASDPVSPEPASIAPLLVAPPVAVVPPIDFVPPVPPPVTPPLLTTPPLPTVLPPVRTEPSVRALPEPPHPESAAERRTQRMLQAAVAGIERVMASSVASSVAAAASVERRPPFTRRRMFFAHLGHLVHAAEQASQVPPHPFLCRRLAHGTPTWRPPEGSRRSLPVRPRQPVARPR
jgi:hypothetical protein